MTGVSIVDAMLDLTLQVTDVRGIKVVLLLQSFKGGVDDTAGFGEFSVADFVGDEALEMGPQRNVHAVIVRYGRAQ